MQQKRKEIAFCPFMIGSETREPIMRGGRTVTVPVLYPCRKEECPAFKEQLMGDLSIVEVCKRCK